MKAKKDYSFFYHKEDILMISKKTGKRGGKRKCGEKSDLKSHTRN